MQNVLAGKRVLVTQSAEFMGPALCRVFAEQGAAVVASAASLVPPASAEEVVRAAGPIDVLVANLALAAPSTPALDVDDDEWRRVFAALVDPLPRLCRAVLSAMRERGRGTIVNVSSMGGYSGGGPGNGTYGATKAALLSITRNMAREWAPFGIRVNAISPGFFPAEQNKKLLFNDDGSYTARGGQIIGHTPMARFGNAEELRAFRRVMKETYIAMVDHGDRYWADVTGDRD